MKLNILFLLKNLEVGGVEVVTTVLANKFSDEGCNVTIWAFSEGKTSIADKLNGRVHLVYGYGLNAGRENVISLRKTLVDDHIQVVVNQWGLPYVPTLTLKRAGKGLGIKAVAVYHNDPSSNGKTKDVEIALGRCCNPLKKTLLRLKLFIFKQATAASMRYVYRNSDLYLVLSESFIRNFKDFTGIRKDKKLCVQANPVTINSGDYKYEACNKEKEIVYMGRIDEQQKRTSRVVETWALIEDKFPGWRLTIVGDGSDREELERKTKKLNLRRVSFEGFQSPLEYYKRASLLMLTSEYEGFPLVLAECMSFGVVPVVYHSYAAVTDIIEDNVDGLIIPYSSENFPASVMATRMEALMGDPSRLSKMAEAATRKSRRFGIDEIYEGWVSIFGKLLEV